MRISRLPFPTTQMLLLCTVLTTLSGARIPAAAEAPLTAGDIEWAAIEQVAHSDEVLSLDKAGQLKVAADLEARVQAFLKRFPQHKKAEQARDMEADLLSYLATLGSKAHQERLAARETAALGDPKTGRAERLGIIVEQIGRRAFQSQDAGHYAVARILETELEELRKMPGADRVFFKIDELLGYAARISPPDRGRVIASALRDRADHPRAAKPFTNLLNQLDLLNKPLALKFTALNGTEVDLAAMKGKVVVLHFWATWCPPCVREVLETKPVYDKLNAQGMEVIGISFDEDKADLEKFLKRRSLTWPQSFEGKNEGNTLGARFHVSGGVPTLWVVDKNGILRHINVGNKLEETVVALLKDSSDPGRFKFQTK